MFTLNVGYIIFIPVVFNQIMFFFKKEWERWKKLWYAKIDTVQKEFIVLIVCIWVHCNIDGDEVKRCKTVKSKVMKPSRQVVKDVVPLIRVVGIGENCKVKKLLLKSFW